jgi:hypothetical protein
MEVTVIDYIRRKFKMRYRPEVRPASPPRVIGVTIGFDLRPHLAFSDGTILWGDADKIFYPEYWPEDVTHNKFAWPIDPETGEKLQRVT